MEQDTAHRVHGSRAPRTPQCASICLGAPTLSLVEQLEVAQFFEAEHADVLNRFVERRFGSSADAAVTPLEELLGVEGRVRCSWAPPERLLSMNFPPARFLHTDGLRADVLALLAAVCSFPFFRTWVFVFPTPPTSSRPDQRPARCLPTSPGRSPSKI